MPKKNQQVFLLSLLMYLLSNPAFSDDRFTDYWTVEEYLALNPKQQSLTRQFEEIVRGPVRKDASGNKSAHIDVIYPGLQVSDYWKRSISSFEKRLQELGQKYELSFYFTKPGQHVSEQSRKLGEFLLHEPDFLIFTLNINRHRGLISKVLSQKSTHVILQNITTPLKSFGQQQPFQYVGFDHVIGTEYIAQEYLRRFTGPTEYAIFYGPPGYVSDMRGGTFLNKMKVHPRMKLVDSYYVGFNREKAYSAALKVLNEHPKIDFIFSSSTDIALGVIDAIRETSRMGSVITNGWGGGSAELQAIEQGVLDLTIMRMNDDNGVAMAEAVALAQSGQANKVPQIYSGDMVLVTKEMSIEEIGGLRTRAFRYSQ